MRDEALWHRLEDYSFDAIGGTLTFPDKLAREAEWPKRFTRRAIEEYRRFIYLTQVSDEEATPSGTVDVVWHMHLTYTREYWHGLCEGVLGRPLHHDPCLGEEENPRYELQYEATRRLYAEEFGAGPPRDIWHLPGSRTLGRIGSVMTLVGLVACYWSMAGMGLVILGAILWFQSDPAGARRIFARAAARSAGGGGCGGGCGGGG